jgi:two-component system phosphate regulon sensor histidine kinase PhoR
MSDILIVFLAIAVGALLYYSWNLRQNVRQNHTDFANIHQQLTHIKRETSQTQAQLLLLSNAAYDALLLLDKEHRILAMNQSAAQVLSCKNGVGKNLVEATNTPELEAIVQAALASDEEAFEEQLTIRDRNFRVRASIFPNGDNLLIGLALQDVTQLVRLNRARRDMVANISHELRTPIANIRLIIDGLFHDQDKPKRKDSISSLKAIAHETDALMWLVQEMADLSMIESGQAVVRMYEVPLAELVEESVQRIADQSDAKDLKIIRHIPDRIKVLCDRDLAKRVIVNLVHNAVKWSPRGQAITISATNGADEVTVSVVDNGPGVPDDQTERIFERFYQVDASRSGNEGTGLGLAICKHIVEAHGGRIWAEGNSDGGGGRFKFTLLSAEEILENKNS